MNARAAMVPLVLALVAVLLFLVGLIAPQRALLDAGCALLLVVPLARNAVVVVVDARALPRLLALALSLVLIVLDVLAWAAASA